MSTTDVASHHLTVAKAPADTLCQSGKYDNYIVGHRMVSSAAAPL